MDCILEHDQFDAILEVVPGVNELLVQLDLAHPVENECSGGPTPGSIPNAGGCNIPQDGAGVNTSLGRLLRVLHHRLVDGLGIGSRLELADESFTRICQHCAFEDSIHVVLLGLKQAPVFCIPWAEVGVEDSVHFLCASGGTKSSVPPVPLLVLPELNIESHVSFDSLLPLH